MIRKVTLRKSIQLEPRETVHIRVNYIGLPKRHSFVITAIYPAATYTVLNSNIPKIAILANSIKKRLEFSKNIRLGTIYEYVDTAYIMADISKVFTAITTVSSVLSDSFSAVQKETIFGNRYQNVNLIIQPFEKGIELLVFKTKFIFIPEIEAMFTVKSSIYSPPFYTDSSIQAATRTSLNDSIYAIIINVV